MMQKLKEEITAAANRELNRANEQFPLFTSKHEGVAVAYEELEESKEALEELEASFKCFIPYCHSFRNLRNSHCRAKLKRRFLKCLNQ